MNEDIPIRGENTLMLILSKITSTYLKYATALLDLALFERLRNYLHSVYVRYRDDYDDKEPAAPSASASSNAEGLVKPAAPSSSVYSRPRTPPKIRRPVPLSEQDKYAYKTTPASPIGKIYLKKFLTLEVSINCSVKNNKIVIKEEPRRRPDLVEDDYYDDEVEDVRPSRRPLRRRPSYRDRDRDRDFYETRDRDRPLR